jgi:UDP-N-acetylglucosamine--N-acetylmuramyl-(pentapeptide) pyrophosphoryl-undecaprenol N-acetylglucosamine transferase
MKVLLAGGGTGGHLYPALGIAAGLRASRPEVDVRFIGSYYGIEARVLPTLNELFYPLDIKGIQRSFDSQGLVNNFKLPTRFMSSYRRSKQILRNFKPDVVIGTGGYASGIPVLAAQRKHIPTLIQEQNSYPGLTNRRLARKAQKICLTYEDSAQFFDTEHIEVTGNPIRFTGVIPDQSVARKNFKIPVDRQVILILGGSQGSVPLNKHFLGVARTYVRELGVHLLWQTGDAHFDGINKSVGFKRGVTLLPFIHDMLGAYAAADLVICRAGAMTISELTYIGKPAILVPFPNAAGDHQTKNADSLVKKRAAIKVDQANFKDGKLENIVQNLLEDPKRLKNMSRAAKRMGHPQALEQIIANIMDILKN